MRGTVRPTHGWTDEHGKVHADPGSTWWWQATLTNKVDGKTSRQTVRRRGYPTKKAAQTALTEFLAAHGRGETRKALTQPSSQLLGEYLTDWLAARKPSLKPTTHDSYGVVVRAWIAPHLGGVPLRALTGSRISAWHAKLRTEGGRGGRPLGTRSVAYASRVLSMALGDAVESGLIAVDPMTEVPRRQRPTHKPAQGAGKVWDAGQARTFLAAVADDRLSTLWTLLLATGCRRGEALGLRWANVDLDKAVVTFARNRVIVGLDVAEGTPKSHKPRTVDLDPATVTALRTWRKDQIEERLAVGSDYTSTPYVFTDELGEPLRPDRVSARFERIVNGLDVPTISLHGLRHTSGTLSLLAGVPLHVVAARLGHDPAVLLRTYAHLMPVSGRDAADKLGAVLFG